MKLSYDNLVRRFGLFLEFLIFGVVLGVIEDLIAVTLATGEVITLRTLGIIILVAIPFAVLGELLVERKGILFGRKKRN